MPGSVPSAIAASTPCASRRRPGCRAPRSAGRRRGASPRYVAGVAADELGEPASRPPPGRRPRDGVADERRSRCRPARGRRCPGRSSAADDVAGGDVDEREPVARGGQIVTPSSARGAGRSGGRRVARATGVEADVRRPADDRACRPRRSPSRPSANPTTSCRARSSIGQRGDTRAATTAVERRASAGRRPGPRCRSRRTAARRRGRRARRARRGAARSTASRDRRRRGRSSPRRGPRPTGRCPPAIAYLARCGWVHS